MTRFTENLISSINALYLALLSFLVVYAYVSYSYLEHNRALTNLTALDKLLALRVIATSTDSDQVEVKFNQLPDFFLRAATEAFASLPDEPDGLERYTYEALAKRGFTDSKIEGVSIRKGWPMRLAPGATCDVLVTRVAPGSTFILATILIVGGVHLVQSENVQLVSFSKCGQGYGEEFNGLIFRLNDGQVAVALSKKLEEQFPGLKPPLSFKSFEFHEMDELKKRLPAPIVKFASLEDTFVFHHLKGIEHFILAYANSRHGRFYQASDFEGATQRLYEEQEKNAPFFGVNAESSLVVRLGPVVFLFCPLNSGGVFGVCQTVRCNQKSIGLDMKPGIS